MKNVLIIDSGVGAISIANEIKKEVKANLFICVDNKNSPYGEKTTTQLFNISCKIVDRFIKKYNIDLIVLACNTLTVAIIDKLREKYSNMQIVGTEPNVKIEKLPCAVLCTKYTCLHSKIIKNSKAKAIAMPKLATLIDKNLFNIASLKEYFIARKDVLSKYKSISLGCTHYTYIKPILKEMFPNVKIYENKFGVAKRVRTLIGKSISNVDVCNIKVFLTKKDKKYLNKLNLMLKF